VKFPGSGQRGLISALSPIRFPANRVKLRIVDHFGRAADLDRRQKNKEIMKYFVLAQFFGILTAKFET